MGRQRCRGPRRALVRPAFDLSVDDLQVELRERDRGRRGPFRRYKDVKRFQPPLQGRSTLRRFPCQKFPFPLELQSGLPRGESRRVADPRPFESLVHRPTGQFSTTFDLFVVLPQPSVQIHGRPHVRCPTGRFEQVNEERWVHFRDYKFFHLYSYGPRTIF